MNYEILFQFLIAALWGGIVGAEREYRSKSAGFRTMIMISVGSCLFTMLSLQIGAGGSADRIASNIVTGIGFLGAGVIFRGENRISGITTAATIWGVAAVGMAIGSKNYDVAAIASLLVVIVLAFLPYFERVIDRLNQSIVYTIKCDFDISVIHSIEQRFLKYGLKSRLISQLKEDGMLTSKWEVYGFKKNHLAFVDEIMQDDSIHRFEY